MRRWIAPSLACALAATALLACASRHAEGPKPPASSAPAALGAAPAPQPARNPDVIFVPTPDLVVRRMLELAAVGPSDVVYDLGCGDGRIVVEAARRGARAVGVDIDPQRVREARAAIQAAGVQDRARIVEGDLFETDLAQASVVTLYLLPDLNLRLRPKLLALPAGTRIVSHAFDMGDWAPERSEEVDGRMVYFWKVPAAGPTEPAPLAPGATR